MYKFQPPPAPRIVDGINVKLPSFYGDTGGPGWFAESQFPVKRRLAVAYKERWGREVYIRPKELIVLALRSPVDLDQISAKFRQFNLVSAELMDRSVASVMLGFATAADAKAALEYWDHARTSGEWTFRLDSPEVNVQGKSAFNLDDILLVREDFAANQDSNLDEHHFHPLATIPEARPIKQAKWNKRAASPDNRDSFAAHRAQKRSRSEEQHAGARDTWPRDKAINHYKLDQVSPPNPFESPCNSTQVGPLTPPPSVSPAAHHHTLPDRPNLPPIDTPPILGPLHRFEQHLQLSSHASYSHHPLPPWPAWFATLGNRLLIGVTAQCITDRYPGLTPVHIDDLPLCDREQLRLEEVRGFRWKVKYDTQEAWRLGGGYLELSPGM